MKYTSFPKLCEIHKFDNLPFSLNFRFSSLVTSKQISPLPGVIQIK